MPWYYIFPTIHLQAYLCKFGYLTAGGDLTEALKEFQRFVKLTPTGLSIYSIYFVYVSMCLCVCMCVCMSCVIEYTIN